MSKFQEDPDGITKSLWQATWLRVTPRALRAFQADFPNVRVVLHDLSNGEMIAQIGEKKLQVALLVRPPAKLLRGLNFEELARYAICVAVSPKHPLARSKSLGLEQIAQEPLIAYSRRAYPEYHEQMEKVFAQAGCKPRFTGEHDGVTSLIAAVESGHGFALMPSCLTFMAGPRLKMIPLTTALPPISVGAIWAKASETELVKQFIAAAKSVPGPGSAKKL